MLLKRLFFFTLFNVLLVFTLATTFFKTYSLFSDPAQVLLTLADKLTQVCIVSWFCPFFKI
jgi:thymidine kinase